MVVLFKKAETSEGESEMASSRKATTQSHRGNQAPQNSLT